MRFLSLALLAATACASPTPGQVPHSRPNVILVSLDTVRADHLGFMGHPAIRTPTLDRLASEGVAFTRAYSNASVTLPSHMSLFTGLLPSKHGVSNPVLQLRSESGKPDELSAAIPTLPELLHQAGYRTARFVHSRDYFLDPAQGFGRGFDELFPYGLDSAAGASQIADWISHHANGDGRGQPFFLFLHSKRPHTPYVFQDADVPPRENYRGEILSSERELRDFMRNKGEGVLGPIPGIIPDEGYFFSKVRKNSPEDLQRLSRLYDRGIELADGYLGTVLARLDSSGLTHQTLVIVTSDHGEEFLEHGGFSHTKLNEEVVHVPMIFRLPSARSGGRRGVRIDEPVQSVDLLPTVTDWVGIGGQRKSDGKSLMPLLETSSEKISSASAPFHDRIFAQNTYVYVPRAASVTEGRWKLIVTEERDRELYDLQSDPKERKNLAGKNLELVSKLELKLKELDFASASETLGQVSPAPGPGQSGVAAHSTTNVLFLSIGSLRPDRLSHAPNLNRLARESFDFTSFFANASSSFQSHASLLTGLYPAFHRADRAWISNRAEFATPPGVGSPLATLPEILRDSGRLTARFAYSRDLGLDASMGFGRGFDEIHPFGLDTRWSAAEIGSWMERNRDRPFFLFVSSLRAHAPYVLPSEEDAFTNVLREKKVLHRRWVPGIEPDDGIFFSLLQKDPKGGLPKALKLYDQAVSLTDELVGTVLRKLGELGLTEKTLIIVSAPTGEEFREHGGFSHLTLHHESLHVPLLVRAPRSILKESPRKVEPQAEGVDLLPTITELLRIPTPSGINGHSLIPLMTGNSSWIHGPTFAQNSLAGLRRASSIRTDRWKLILNEDDRTELFDLREDPGELRNVASSMKSVVSELMARVRELELASSEFPKKETR